MALQVTLVERATGKVLFTRPRLEMRESYEIPLQQGQYFDESDAALRASASAWRNRWCRRFLNNF